MRPTSTKARPEELIAELGRAQGEFAAAERRARTYLAAHGVLDQTQHDVRALLREAAEPGNTTGSETV
jgi:hypothetical protein